MATRKTGDSYKLRTLVNGDLYVDEEKELTSPIKLQMSLAEIWDLR